MRSFAHMGGFLRSTSFTFVALCGIIPAIMPAQTPTPANRTQLGAGFWIIALVLIVLLGAQLRFAGLGSRSLWLDEFSTWHVSRMELGEGLRWSPELTKPPLYQLTLRALSDDLRPSEWMLRFPAALSGVLVIVAGWWLGKIGGGWVTGLALAGLLACNSAQLDASEQARSYTMLVLGCTLSTTLWYRLVAGASRRGEVIAYVIVTVLTFHAHYLTLLTVAAQAGWWLCVRFRVETGKRSFHPLLVMGLVGALCIPMVVHYLRFQSSIFQGLDWIPPGTWGGAFDMLSRLTFGGVWVVACLGLSLLLWGLALSGVRLPRRVRSAGRVFTGRYDLCGLLVVWLLFAWCGLIVISLLGRPVMVERYALPAAIPALLIPLIVAFRLDRRLPLFLMGVFMVAAAPTLGGRASESHVGFRELSRYLNENVNPDTGVVVMVIDGAVPKEWADMERLGFGYYPLDDLPVSELLIKADGTCLDGSVLLDPRALYLVVFSADPVLAVQAAGRRLQPFRINDQAYTQLAFLPYRLMRVAPRSGDLRVPEP